MIKTFSINKLKRHELFESILDFPKDTLSPDVWVEKNGQFELTEYAESIIYSVIDWVRKTFNIPNMGACLVGSIASNSYGTKSDIDIHFYSENIKPDKADDFGKILKKRFNNEFKQQNPELSYIGVRPIEVYFQQNPLQDLMSVGCYDLLNRRWLVGPDLKDEGFDPYEEYYKSDMRNVKDLIDDIRANILSTYEISIVLLKTTDEKFRKKLEDNFISCLKKCADLFTKLRNHRKLLSSPKTREEALKLRTSREWKIADSSFKLLNKFGYVAILKTITDAYVEYTSMGNQFNAQSHAKNIIDAFTENISTNQLIDSEKELNESATSLAAKVAMIAALIGLPSLLPAKALQNGLMKIAIQKPSELNKNSPAVKELQQNILTDKTIYGTLNAFNTVNMLQYTMMSEAQNQFRKVGKICFESIASIVWNRAGGNPQKFVAVISRKDQFSEWNSYTGGWTDKDYIPQYSPNMSDPRVQQLNKICESIALDMLYGKFDSVIGNRNMIANARLDNPIAYASWGSKCDLQLADHCFGYQRDQDGWRRSGVTCPYTDDDIAQNPNFVLYQKNTYIVKAGDSVKSIANKFGISPDSIKVSNPSIKDINKIKVGQKLTISIPKKFFGEPTKKQQSKQIDVEAKPVQPKPMGSKIIIAKAGDSLWKIAQANNTTVDEILNKNRGLTRKSKIAIGQKINI